MWENTLTGEGDILIELSLRYILISKIRSLDANNVTLNVVDL